jgi:biotin synthase
MSKKEKTGLRKVLERVAASAAPERSDLIRLLEVADPTELDLIYKAADRIREENLGPGILLRGLVEFSNHCHNACHYCGLNRDNLDLQRYRMKKEEILAAAAQIAASGLKTVILQSGDDLQFDAAALKAIIDEIKEKLDLAVTLSVGERSFEEYLVWKLAGADRYLLKIETTDRALYEKLHPGMSWDRRHQALKDLQALGYQTGSGNLVGLPGQTLASLTDDILYFKEMNFDMIGIGPFIPHGQTPLAGDAGGTAEMVLKVLALTRIVTKNSHLPATTALGSLEKDFRAEGLRAGANVLMVNFTPPEYRQLYQIYPGKKCLSEAAGACLTCFEPLARQNCRVLDFSRGDTAVKKSGGRENA